MFRRASFFAFVILTVMASIAAAQVHSATKTKSAKAAATVGAAPQPVAGPTSISGLATSGRNCLAATSIGVHYLGWVDQRARITVSFSADFDPVASATIMRFGERAPNGLVEGYDDPDDDSGGGFNPLIDVEAEFGGYLVLFVSPYANAGPGGCYFYKAEIRTP